MLAFLGGTGPEGRGLALRLALAGERAIIGSRDAGRAATAAEEMQLLAPGTHIEGRSTPMPPPRPIWSSSLSPTRDNGRCWSSSMKPWPARLW